MATAISVANFQTAVGNCYDAIAALNKLNAYMYYAMAEAQLAGLQQTLSDSDASVSWRISLDALGRALEAAFAVIERSGQHSRFIKAKTRYGRGGYPRP